MALNKAMPGRRGSIEKVKVTSFTISRIANMSVRRAILLAILIFEFAVVVYLFLPSNLSNSMAQLKLAPQGQRSLKASTSSSLYDQSYLVEVVEDPPVTCETNRPMPRMSDKFVVLSVTTPSGGETGCIRGGSECSHVFNLPAVAFGWQKLNYSVAVMIAGDPRPWLDESTYLHFVHQKLVNELKAVIIFIPIADELKVSAAMVGRLFAADFAPFNERPELYLVIADADVFPLKNIYDLESQSDVKITNPKCCGTHSMGGLTNFQLISPSGVGMRVLTWHQIMQYRKMSNNTDPGSRIMESIQQMYDGKLPSFTKRSKSDWFMDSEMLSFKIQQFKLDFNTKCKDFINKKWPPLNPIGEFKGGLKRVDSNGWPAHKMGPYDWNSYNEAHCPQPGQLFESVKYFSLLVGNIIPAAKFDLLDYYLEFARRIGATDMPNKEAAAEQIKAIPTDRYATINLYHPLDIEPTKHDYTSAPEHSCSIRTTKTAALLILLTLTSYSTAHLK